MNDYIVLISEDGQPYISHHGIKGQKWGIRRYQNPDGSLTAEGLRRYGNPDGSLNAKGIKALAKTEQRENRAAARSEYKQKTKDINKRYYKDADKYETKRSEILFGLNSGGISDRIKKHMKNEYEFSKKENKYDQERLNARREYRSKVGKKKVDTFLMKQYQKSINDIAKETQGEFNERYVRELVSDIATLGYNAIRRPRDDY